MVWPAAPGRRGVADPRADRRRRGPAGVRDVSNRCGKFSTKTARAPLADFQRYDAAGAECLPGEAGSSATCPRVVQRDRRYRTGGRRANWRARWSRRTGATSATRRSTIRPRSTSSCATAITCASNLPEMPSPRPATPVMQFPNGSIAIKAAWLDMAGFSDEQVKRYYTRTADRAGPGDRRVLARDGRAGRAAHHAEDAEPAAVDLVVIRADRQRAAVAVWTIR